MRRSLITILALGAFVPSLMAVQYNQNVTAIYGSGNPDGGWTTETGGGITVGLRGKNRTTGATPNVNGVYTFPTGTVGSPARALWNFEFSINSGTAPLSSYIYSLSVDLDPSQGVNFLTFNPLTGYGDNSYGNAGTANGQGIEGLASALAGGNTIAQNSQNIVFLGLNPLLDGTYDYVLTASSAAGGPQATVGITVVVGNGGSRVPDAGSTVALLGTALVGLAGLRRKFGV
jgi:hypothetical protein